MKKNTGTALPLYPTPLVVVGAMAEGEPNWTLVDHLGIIGHDHVLVSMAVAHHSNKGIRETRVLSMNVLGESWLKKANYCGCVSVAKTDKSGVFTYTMDGSGVSIIDEAKLSMACAVEDVYKTPALSASSAPSPPPMPTSPF